MTPTLEIRAADPSSYGALVDLQLERIPSMRRHQAKWLFRSASTMAFLHLRSAHLGGELAGWGLAMQPPDFPPGFAIVAAFVRRSCERQGIGGALFRELVDTLPDDIATIGTGVRDDEPESRAIAEAHGFRVLHHGIESELELVDLPEPTPVPGVTYEDVSDLVFPDEEAVDAMLVDSQTNPEAAEVGIVTHLSSIRAEAAGFGQMLAVLARVDGAPAAVIFGHLEDGALAIHYTGVGRSFRGRNLAFALKQYAHLRAAEAGATISLTTNEESNAGIRHVNRKLGYRVTGGLWRMHRARPAPGEL